MPPVQAAISCPNCRRPVTAAIQQLFDATQDPGDKQRFLQGGFNMIRCPNCGFQGMASTPLVYHDADKELLLTYVPGEVALPKDEQERLLGRLINQATNVLPQEKRKGYLLRPQPVFTLQGMVEKVLEGEGITREVLEVQRQKMSLLQALLRTPPESLPETIRAKDADLDEAFFQLLSTTAAAAAAGGEDNTRQRLGDLSRALAEHSTYGQQITAQYRETEAAAKELRALGNSLTHEKLVDLVVSARNPHRETALVSLTRPAVDYQFFQLLTSRIDKAEEEEKTRLSALRDRIVDLTRQIDEAERAQATRAAQVLQAILEAPDPDQAIEDNLPAIDETFMAVLSANLEAAEQAGRKDVVGRLEQVANLIMSRVSGSAPPEIQFVNELLEKETEAEAETLFRERGAEMGTSLIDAMRYVAASLREQGQTEAADRLDRLSLVAVRESMAANWRARAQ